MATGNRKKIDEARIRELIDRWLKALRAKNLDGIMSCYTPDILLFDLLPPLQYLGADAYRKNWAEWFSTFRGPIGYEILHLSLTTGDEVAFSHSLNRNQRKEDRWGRNRGLGARNRLLQQDRRQVDGRP